MSYLSVPDINLYLGTSNEDALIGVILENAEQIFDDIVWWSLLEADYTEKFTYPQYVDNNWLNIGHIFYLQQINPTVIKKIDWTSVTANTDYYLQWNKVFLKNALTYQNTFPFLNSVEYTAGYDEVPTDVKQAIYILCWALYNSKGSNWIDSFRQDLLSVNYSKTWVLDKLVDPNSFSLLSSIFNKYRKVTVLSTWNNRTII